MVPKPSWLRFKRWRSKGAPRDQCELQPAASQSSGHHEAAAAAACDAGRGSRLISEQSANPGQQQQQQQQLQASSSEREKQQEPKTPRAAVQAEQVVANHQASGAGVSERRGRPSRRRLCELMPRALTQLIERAVSPNVRRANNSSSNSNSNSNYNDDDAEHQQQSRPKSPLRKLHKHLKQSQESASSQASRDEPAQKAGDEPAGRERPSAAEATRASGGHQSECDRNYNSSNNSNSNNSNNINEARKPPVEISNVQRESNERARPDCDPSRAEEANELDQRRHSGERQPKPLVTGAQIRPAQAKASPLPLPLPRPSPPRPTSLEGAYNRSVNEVTPRPASARDEQQQRQRAAPEASGALCQLSAKTRDNQCALHGSNVALCRLQQQRQAGNERRPQPAAELDGGTKSELAAESKAVAPVNKTPKRKRGRTPREKARSVSTWPLAKQTLDNNLPNEFRLGHFGDCEDLLSAHLAGRLFGALTAHDLISIRSQQSRRSQSQWPSCNQRLESVPGPIVNDNHRRPDHQQAAAAAECQPQTAASTFDQLIFQATSDALKLADQLRLFNYNHKRPFALPYETPPTGWLFNATGLQPINSGSAHALRAKLFASNKFRRRSYDDQEGDNDINIILQPSDIDDIEKRARLGYARLKATTTQNGGYPKATSTTTITQTSATSSATNNDQDPQTINTTTTTTTTTRNKNLLNQKSRHPSQQAHKLKAFEGIFEDIKLAKCLLDQDYNQTVRLFIERSALNWNFNSFTFDALCCGRSLTELLLHLFDYYNLYAIFNLDIIKVLKCFRLLEFGYHSTNPYHNSVHAADVTQAMHCFIQEQKIRSHMTDLEILCSILAAVCHDLDHPGVNQSFLVATNNPLASLYQNNSVLENHHWRFALCIFRESKLFDHFDEPVLDDMKQQIKQLILATDIARQNDYLKRFKALTNSKQFSMSNTEDRALVLQMALKCADLGNPCRPWLISRVWSNLICDEFYRMGQIERRLGVPLTPICQRNKTSIAGIQTDFFRFIVLPLLELWHNFLSSPLSDLLMANFDHNYQRWQRANRIVQQLRRRKSVASLEPVGDLPDGDEPSDAKRKQAPISGKQLRSVSLIQSSLVEVFAGAGSLQQRRDSFELIKRASSDYIKSGNGRLESLRDFQLNRIIEKSPVISRLVIEPLN